MLLVINYEPKSTTSIRNIMSEANNYYPRMHVVLLIEYSSISMHTRITMLVHIS